MMKRGGKSLVSELFIDLEKSSCSIKRFEVNILKKY